MATYDPIAQVADCTCSSLENIGLSLFVKHKRLFQLVSIFSGMFDVLDVDIVRNNLQLAGNEISTCWMTVHNIEVSKFAPVDLPAGCGAPVKLPFDTLDCHNLKHRGLVLRNSVIQDYSVCNAMDPMYLSSMYIRKSFEDITKNFFIYFMDLLFSSVLKDCKEISYAEYSVTGKAEDKSSTGLTIAVVDEIVDTLAYNVLEDPSDIWLFVDTEGFRQYKNELAAKYPNCGSSCVDGRDYLVYQDPHTGISIMVLPRYMFKTDSSGNPIYVAFNKSYLTFKLGIPAAISRRWSLGVGNVALPYGMREISDSEFGGIGSLVRFSHVDINYTSGWMMDMWIGMSMIKYDPDGFMFIIGKK